MKRITLYILTAAAAIALASCGETVDKTPATGANSTNTAVKPTPAAPTKEALIALETKAFEAWKNKDGKYFDGFLTDSFVMIGESGRVDKAAAVKSITEDPCDIKSFSFSDEQLTPAGDDAAILTLRSSVDGTCGGEKIQSQSWVATVYVRSQTQWKAAYHNEIPIPDPNAKPAVPVAKTSGKIEPGTDTKPADTATEALLAVEKKGWEAWRDRDANTLDQLAGNDLILIDLSGQRFEKTGAIKTWTESQCEIAGFTLSEPAGVSLTKDAGLLLFKGTADGRCDGRELSPIWQTSVYVRQGESWKYVMVIQTPA